MRKNLIPWSVFSLFVVFALAASWHPTIFQFEGAVGVGKAIVWLAFITFTGYSIYCSGRENLFRSIGSIAKLHWGRQVGLDLYLGLILFLGFVFLREGLLVLLFWSLPVLLFGNLATLLYVAIHFESIVSLFTG